MKTPVARRSTAESPARRYAKVTLATGAFLAVGAGFGGLWFVRAGIAVAIVAGVLAAILLTRELRSTIALHRTQMTEQARRHDQILSDERRREREVLDVIDVRTGALKSRIQTLTGDLDVARRQLTAAEKALAEQTLAVHARDERLAARDLTIAELRARVARLEQEVAILAREAMENDAEMIALPRRVSRARASRPRKRA